MNTEMINTSIMYYFVPVFCEEFMPLCGSLPAENIIKREEMVSNFERLSHISILIE